MFTVCVIFGFTTLIIFLFTCIEGDKKRSIKNFKNLIKFVHSQNSFKKRFFFYGLGYLEIRSVEITLFVMSFICPVIAFKLYQMLDFDFLKITLILSTVLCVLNFLAHGTSNEILKNLKDAES